MPALTSKARYPVAGCNSLGLSRIIFSYLSILYVNDILHGTLDAIARMYN